MATDVKHSCGSGRRESSLINKLILVVFIVALFPIPMFTQAAAPNGWNDPFTPHKVMDNFCYVGTKELASFLNRMGPVELENGKPKVA
jgi:hypothetical protein